MCFLEVGVEKLEKPADLGSSNILPLAPISTDMADPKPLGRGRGRGRDIFVEAKPAVTPGIQQSSGDATSKDDADTRIRELSNLVRDLKVTPVDVTRVKIAILLYSQDDERMREAISVVYDQCKNDWHNADDAVNICQQLMLDSISKNSNPKRFREIMLQNLQKDFKVKDDLAKSNHTQYLGCLAFLCQIVAKLRDENNHPFRPLLKPACQALCALMCLNGEEEDLECAAHQLISVSKTLYDHSKEEMEVVIVSCKEVILDARGSRTCRKTLLSVVEAFTSNWELPPRLYV